MIIPESKKIIFLGNVIFDLNYLYNESPTIFPRPIDIEIVVMLNNILNYNNYISKYFNLFFETQDSSMVIILKTCLEELIKMINELINFVPESKNSYKLMCERIITDIGILNEYII